MSSIWSKARRNTPEIDCGLCGFPTCATFARTLVSEGIAISKCPILSLEIYRERREELTKLPIDSRTIIKPAPEQPEGGVLLSKPCMDAPDLLMAEMRIFNGVEPGLPQRFGVLDPVILCWLLDCVSSKYQDMRCSKELAYAWGDMEEIKVHILRDGRVRMRRARGKEHALESFRIIERTVIGAAVCNCCGHDLLSVLSGFAPPSTEEIHPVLKAGSTLYLNPDQIEWTLNSPSGEHNFGKRMLELIEPIHASLVSQLDLMIMGDFKSESIFDARPKICSFINLMFEQPAQDYLVVLLKGLAQAFFLDNALRALADIRLFIHEQKTEADFVIQLLKSARNEDIKAYQVASLNSGLIPLLAHAKRVARSLSLFEMWI